MSLKTVANLLSPLRYLCIKHEDKRAVDIWIPVFIAAIVTAILLNLPKPVALLGKDGFIAQVNGLLQLLTGFYIAALAAVSTFQAKGMDELMLGKPPKVYEPRSGRYKLVSLSRRRFLCYLFGYLALICFLIFALGLFINIVSASLSQTKAIAIWYLYFRACTLFIYLFFLANMMTVTLWGLYYLTIKIHVGKVEREAISSDVIQDSSTDDEGD